jgi:hypothetical protein
MWRVCVPLNHSQAVVTKTASCKRAAEGLFMQLMQVTASARRHTHDKQAQQHTWQGMNGIIPWKLKVMCALLCIQQNMTTYMTF